MAQYVGILTAGGDSPGLNAAIRGVAKAAIGAYDMLKGFEVAGKNFGRPIEAYLAAAVLYFVMCYALSWSVKRLHQRIAIIR